MAKPRRTPCGKPGCQRWTLHYYACSQHRALLPHDLMVRLETAWREQHFDRTRWERTRAEALKAWGWQAQAVECST